MNLVIDIGNSRTKLAIFEGNILLESAGYDLVSIDILRDLSGRYPKADQAILSSVNSIPSGIQDFLRNSFRYFIQLAPSTPIPIRNGYHSPETLGLDRIAAAVGANECFPGEDLLVIDMGTAITIDLVEKQGIFLGGNISPGMRTRFRSLHEFTNRLPLIDESELWPLLGQSTDEAIRAGVLNGIIFEIEGSIQHFQKNYPDLRVVLTGGDALFFERKLKNRIFVKSDVTLIGLNRILEYNAEKK